MADDQVTHGHLLQAIGRLEGMVDGLGKSINERRDDVTRALDRVSVVEEKVGRMLGACLVLAVVLPLTISAGALALQYHQIMNRTEMRR